MLHVTSGFIIIRQQANKLSDGHSILMVSEYLRHNYIK